MDRATMVHAASHGHLLGGGVVGCATEEVGRGQVTEARTLEFIP